MMTKNLLHRSRYKGDTIAIVLLTIAIPSLVFAASLLRTGERNIGIVETIYGIPYPTVDGAVLVVEEMAHADLFLEEPVFAKQAKLTIAFDPGTAKSISIGIRENEFWLSYRKYPLYTQGVDASGFQTKEITIPVTDVLQDTDRSVDVMFFTDSSDKAVEWKLHTFRASLQPSMPSFAEAKSYIKSVLVRERAL